MNSKQKGITLAASLGGLVLLFILVFGTMWTIDNSRKDTDSAVHSVSLLYLDELAGRREQVVSANLQEKINVIETALDMLTEEDLSDGTHLQAYQTRIKLLDHVTEDVAVEADLAVKLGHFIRAETEVEHPVGAAAMVVDGVRQLAFVPETAYGNDAAQGFDDLGKLAGDFVRIARIRVRIQKKETIINVDLSHLYLHNV